MEAIQQDMEPFWTEMNALRRAEVNLRRLEEDQNEKRADGEPSMRSGSNPWQNPHLEGFRAEALEYLCKEKEGYMTTNILYQFWIQEASKNRKLCESKQLAKQVDETKSKYADFEKQEAKLREELKYAKEQQKELQSMQKKELKKQKNNLGKKCTKMKS
ncbi:unnamed protein product [Peronospora farinosa]|uniref:Uncharacterized protein n=1 Tax=Peronospora farinosa TaxID=134698 RepID=A0AAV0T856_9STRA|nr:unnamed protein product [Peronospora farinosa]